MEEYLLGHPEMDKPFDKILRDSGYLDIWKYDYEKNPWYYYFEAFEQGTPEGNRLDLNQMRLATAVAAVGKYRREEN